MSILLDAVTRAKQQEQGIDLVITPQEQYQQMNAGLPMSAKLGLVAGLLLLLVCIAWLFSPVGPFKSQVKVEQSSSQVMVQIEETVQAKPVVVEVQAQPKQEQQEPSQNSVQLAGKVALPVAVERPVTRSNQQSSNANLAQGSNTIAMATRAESEIVEPKRVEPEAEHEPIILGAKSNQRGQDLLDSLRAQVNEAANEVGLTQGGNSRESANTSSAPSDNLVAAFQSALAEVEKNNSIAKPVTEPKLDPIPTPKADTLPNYGQLPAGVQLQVPEFNILAHVYSTKASNRWLNVDGKELQEGDSIGGKLNIVEIRPRDVVLEISGTQFKVPAI